MEEEKNIDMERYVLLAQQMKQTMIELENMKEAGKKKFYKKYTEDQVAGFLLDPLKNEAKLREISRYLAVSSPQYSRLLAYLPSIAIIKPIIVPFDMDKIKKNVSKTEKSLATCTKTIDNMSVSHEFLKILSVLTREDTFFGYEIETDDSYYIKQLSPDYCRLRGKYDGCFTYDFNFAFFDDNKDELINYQTIDKEFEQKYNAYKSGKEDKWQLLNIDKEVCMKFQETFDFSCPPYISVFNDLYDIIIYKDLNKQKFENEINTFIGLKMPVRKEGNKTDDFLLEKDTMVEWFNFIKTCLGGKVGLFMSPFEFEDLSFASKNGNSSNANDMVTSAVKSFWSSTGVADVLVGENKNAGTLKYSITTDEALLFQIYRQLERFMSRKIKKISNGLFKVMIPNLTTFNVETMSQRYMLASQYGYNGAISLVEATLGLSQNEANGLGYLENEVLKKHESMIPVSSSHTQSGLVTGIPTEDDEEVSDSTQQSRDDSVVENR